MAHLPHSENRLYRRGRGQETLRGISGAHPNDNFGENTRSSRAADMPRFLGQSRPGYDHRETRQSTAKHFGQNPVRRKGLRLSEMLPHSPEGTSFARRPEVAWRFHSSHSPRI